MPIKFKVLITQSAERDVEAIYTFIAEDSPMRAQEFIAELEHQVKTLEHFPRRCSLIPENEILKAEYRQLIYGDYRTIFRIHKNFVYVLRIIHGSRLLEDSSLEA
ncbi:MAG: type II toxin-antitoxin system RelE/ParE family toxin [Deltaproteobacteria bacterium]|nr:type II toxin-antitoxin system RelE/ParE family toxin [Deltaproteobacteria bacterium]